MAWYDLFLILAFIIGVLLIIFSHDHHKRNVTFGLILVFLSLIIKAFLWFEGLL